MKCKNYFPKNIAPNFTYHPGHLIRACSVLRYRPHAIPNPTVTLAPTYDYKRALVIKLGPNTDRVESKKTIVRGHFRHFNSSDLLLSPLHCDGELDLSTFITYTTTYTYLRTRTIIYIGASYLSSLLADLRALFPIIIACPKISLALVFCVCFSSLVVFSLPD